MAFPVLADRQVTCPTCGKKDIGRDYPEGAPFPRASLFTGAYSSHTGQDPTYMGSFCMLGWDSTVEERRGHIAGASLELAKNVNPKYRDAATLTVYFCSTQCLRSFLNAAVDELEKKAAAVMKKVNASEVS